MKHRPLLLFLILCLLLAAALPGGAWAGTDHPVRMSAEPDPESELTGAGTLSYVRFTVKNTGEEAYTLYEPVLTGDVLEESCDLYFEEETVEAGEVTLEGNSVKEFYVYDIYIPENALNTDIRFTLSWQEAVYTEAREEAEPEEDPTPEEEDTEPEEETEAYELSFVKRKISTTVYIETAAEAPEDIPSMGITVKAGSTSVRSGEDITVRYVLSNPSEYDFEDIILTDNGAGGRIETESDVLPAGESVTVKYTLTMGEETVTLCPEAEYTVCGENRTAVCAAPLEIEYINDSLTLDVEQYAATEAGTLFKLTVTNKGSGRMREIELTDDTGTALCDAFSLNPGQSRIVSYTYGSYTGLQENRRVSFLIHAVNSAGETYLYQKPGSYEVYPYVGSGQVSLLMNVTLADFFEDTDTVQLLFEIRNYSDVAISNAVITETEVLGAAVRSYASLPKGTTTFTMDFTLAEGVSVLTFHMDADDAGGTHYATESVSLHVDQLALTLKNSTFGAETNTVINTSGTVFDTDPYLGYIKNGMLALGFAALVCFLVSGMFGGAEKLVRKDIPAAEPVARTTSAGTMTQDTARLRFGYVKPAKLRYSQTEDPKSTTGSGRVIMAAGNTGALPEKSDSRGAKARTTGTYAKPKKQVHMLTDAQTQEFALPYAPRREKAAFITDSETKKQPLPQNKPKAAVKPKVTAPRISDRPVDREPAPETKKTPERRLTMRECLAAGKPYSFETAPLPAVIPGKTEQEIVFIESPRFPA